MSGTIDQVDGVIYFRIGARVGGKMWESGKRESWRENWEKWESWREKWEKWEKWAGNVGKEGKCLAGNDQSWREKMTNIVF